jgi:methylisocitrate lyase
LVRSIAPHDVFTALILEEAGIELLFLGGFGVSASAHGLPDLGFLGAGEMAEAARRLVARVAVPVIVDGDTGHGDLHHVARTVGEFERAGAAGMLLEDQESPKRCGHFDGKRVIPAAEMALKIRAAVRARQDQDFVILARTDAREPLGLDEAIDRAHRCLDAGADMTFVEAPRSRTELEAIATRVPGPKLANLLTHGKTPVLPAADLEAMGYRVAVLPIETLLVTAHAVRCLARDFLQTGQVRSLEGQMASFDDIKRLLGVERQLGLRSELERGG